MSTPVSPWHIAHTVLRMELTPDRVVTTAELHVESDTATTEPLVLQGRGLETLEVTVDARVLLSHEFELDAQTLTLHLEPGSHVVSTRVAVTPGRPGDKGIVHNHGLISTNVEPEGFRRITWFLDRPSHRSTFDVTVVGDPDAFPVMRANGDPAGTGMTDDGRIWARFVDPVAKPSYLFAMVAGDLRRRSTATTTRSGRTLTLTVLAPPELIDGADFALWVMPEVVAFDEANGGIEHDLDELVFVAVPGYPDATEYHGLMFFDPALLVADPRGHTDDDLMLVALNSAHEYGHHVRGNRVTVRTWGELTLKEGLTVLTAQNDFRAHLFGPAARVLDVLDLRRLQFPEEVTMGFPVLRGEVPDPTALYNRTTYLKGAEIFGMLRTVLGDATWRDVFTTFVARHDLDSASVSDFVAVTRELAPEHADHLDAVARWFHTAGRPALSMSADRAGVSLERTDDLSDDPTVGIPVVMGFRTLSGEFLDVSVDGGPVRAVHTLMLTDRTRRLIVDAREPFVVSPLRGYCAPVDLHVDMPAEHLALLVEADDDPFARWWAGQELMTRAIDAHRAGDGATADGMVEILATTLSAVSRRLDDPVLLAQLLAVPDEFMLGDREPVIDIDGVAAGLAFLRRRLGEQMHDVLVDVWQRFDRDNPFGATPGDLATRMLVEPVLAPLLAVASPHGTQLALDALDSPNPTRAMRAFTQLAHADHVDIDRLVAQQYERWEHAPKLVDRWLRAQSGARRPDTIQRVAALAAGPLYDRDDRSRVMGVWFPFATRNRVVFHHPSGDGYRIFVDELGELMPRNAGLAVRLVGDLLQFQRFDQHRRALLRAELERMATMEGMPDFAVGILRNLLAEG